MTDDNAIFPTHTCFTDALELLQAWALDTPELLTRTMVVHAIVQPAGRERYAHAWLAVRTPQTTEAWQAGLWQGHRITFAVPASELETELRVERKWEYTPEQVLAENKRSGNFGPWVPELRALCTNHQIDETQQELAR